LKDFNLIYVASGCRLFFWEYASNNPWFSYDGIDKEIQFVDCVKLKPGIFDVAIVHALVVVTATDVLLLSIHTTHDAVQPSVVSMNTIVPIQGFSVMDLVCTPSGRVLLGCSDGSLREFLYEPRVAPSPSPHA